MSSTNTCRTNQRFHKLYKHEWGVYKGYCFTHIRDICIGTVHTKITAHVHIQLEELSNEFHYSSPVSTNIKEVMYSVHKEFRLVANYAKGHGQIFRDWFIKKHVRKFLLTIEQTSSSSQDIVAMGVIGIYYNRNVYLQFLDKRMR